MKTAIFSDLAVRYQPIENLIPYPRNSRTHSKHQLRKIAQSIREFGFTNPIFVARNKTIIAGHGRVAAAKLLGIDQVPTIELEQLSDDQIQAYVLADNKLAEEAGWDKSILAIELQYLSDLDTKFDVTLTGFEAPEIDLIIEEARNISKQDKDDKFVLPNGGSAITPS